MVSIERETKDEANTRRKARKQRQNLFDAIEASRLILLPFRENRRDLVSQFCGDVYGDKSFNGGDRDSNKRTYINLMNLTADTYTMAMAANNPQVNVTTKFKKLAGFANHYQEGVNNQLEAMRFSETLRAIVMDAFFGLGVAKVFMADGEDVEIDDEMYMDVGKPFVENISLDDFFFDTNAKRWEQIRFCGNRYRVPMSDLKDDDKYDQDVAKYAVKSRYVDVTEDGQLRTSALSKDRADDYDDFEDMCDLIDVWFPREGVIRTYLEDKPELKELAEVEWDGPDGGPYYILSFIDVPDNIMPVAPAYNITHLDSLMNRMYRKFSRQVGRQKDITAVMKGNEDDGKSIGKANDGDIVAVTDPNSVAQLKFGGVDQGSLAFSIQTGQVFNKASGNIDAMAGLGASAGTVGQEEMIQSAVSEREAKMQTRVLEFVEKIAKVIGHMLWTDEFREIPGEITLPGTDITVNATWEPDYREGRFVDYNFNVTPYSMSYQSPSQMLASLDKTIQETVIPLMDYIMQQGGSFDIQQYLKLAAEYTNNPGITEVVNFQNPPTLPGTDPDLSMFGGDGAGTPTNTTREYVRKSVSTGGTPEARENVMMQSLMGGSNSNNPQQQAMAGSFQ